MRPRRFNWENVNKYPPDTFPYVIRASARRLPGGYRCTWTLALLEIDCAWFIKQRLLGEEHPMPKMISARAKGCKRVVKVWPGLYLGHTERCSFSKAYREAVLYAQRIKQEPP